MGRFRDNLMDYNLGRILTFHLHATEGADTLTIHTYKYPIVIDWGDGSPAVDGLMTMSHTYARGHYILRIGPRNVEYSDGVLVLDDSTINIMSSNERWSALPGLTSIKCSNCSNSELALTSLPDNPSDEYDYTAAFFSDGNALLPLRELPKSATTLNNFAVGCKKAILPFNELPPNLVGVQTNAFAYCHEATFTVTSIPAGVTGLNGTFSKCWKANIKLSSLPANIANMNLAFEETKLEMNLDEIVANAPEGGFTALTNLNGTFFGCKGVTGSRSRFLAACPNAVTNEYTFRGTTTTE